MGHIDYCSLCKYVYTKDCNYGSKECNQEKARIMLEVSRFEKMGAKDVLPINQWISCKEKMPDDGVNVLIYAGNRMISLAWYDKDMGYFYICDSDYKYNSLDVTHWQPLPEPPKEGEQNENN